MKLSKRIMALTLMAALVVASSTNVLAETTSKKITGGTATLVCITKGADATLVPIDSAYTSWCRVTPYDANGVAIPGISNEKIGTAKASYGGTVVLSKAVGAFLVKNVTPSTVVLYANAG